MKLEHFNRIGEEMKLNGKASSVEGDSKSGHVDSDDEEMISTSISPFHLDHSSCPALFHSLNMMRKNRTFCDVTLHVGNKEVHGHRAVLASASPHLMELFTTDADKGIHEAIVSYKLNGDIEHAALEKLIDYAYTAKLVLNDVEDVRAVFSAACQLKMDSVAKECGVFLAANLDPNSALVTRSLPSVTRDPALISALDAYIESNFEEVRKSALLLSLPCIRVEVLSQTKEEMALARQEPLCQLTLDWLNKLSSHVNSLTDKTHLLYLALDNSLQDCSDMPAGDVNDTDLVQDYKKMSKASHPNKGRKVHAVAKPRVLIYNRDINDVCEEVRTSDTKVIASTQIGEHAFLGLVSLKGKLNTLSVVMRHNPVTPGSPGSSQGSVDQEESQPSPPMYTGLANMVSVKCGAGCANLDNLLFVCGGYDRGECLKSVELYTPGLNAWQTLAPMLEARGRFNIAVADSGDVYAVGGSNGTTELATVERYRKGAWERVASLPLARSHTGVCNLEGKIYCVGGWNGQVGIKQCDVFDPASGDWQTVAPLKTGRYQAGTCSMGDKLWVVGGCDGWNCLTSVEMYDAVDNVWSYVTPMIQPRRGCGLAVFKGKLYAVGGSDGVHTLSSTEIYDPDTDTWTRGPDTTTPRSNVGVAVIEGRLYAVGGFSGKTFLNSIEFLDESTDEWTTFSPIDDRADPKLIEALTAKFSQVQTARCKSKTPPSRNNEMPNSRSDDVVNSQKDDASNSHKLMNGHADAASETSPCKPNNQLT